jgi:transposase-like protein
LYFLRITCPSCQSENFKLNEHTYNGKQNHLCKDCGRQFGLNPSNKLVLEKDKSMIDKAFIGKISLAGIARSMEVSQVWLQSYLRRSIPFLPR